MEKIDELEDHQGFGSVDSVVESFELIHDNISEPSDEQYQYEYYLIRGSNESKHDILKQDEFDSDLDTEQIRFDAFFAWIVDKTQTTSVLTDEISQFYNRFKNEFEDRRMFDYLTARIYSLSYDQHELTRAIESGYTVAKEVTTNPNIQYTLCNSVLRYLQLYDYSDIHSETLPEDEETLLDECIWLLKSVLDEERILTAQTRGPPRMPLYPNFLEILVRLHLANNSFDEAHEELTGAIEATNRSEIWERYQQRIIYGLNELERQISLMEQYSEFDQRVSEAQDQMREFEQEIERNRMQTLQFIGFFAGVITAILTIVQIVVQVESVASSSRLILVLISGLLVAFAGFSFMITERSNWNYLIRTGLVFLLGAAGLYLGLFWL